MAERELTVPEIIEDLQAADDELHRYEQKYGLASTVFYELYRQGRLDDGGYELTEDLGSWAGVYEIKLDRERRFLELSRDYVTSLKTEHVVTELESLLEGGAIGLSVSPELAAPLQSAHRLCTRSVSQHTAIYTRNLRVLCDLCGESYRR